MGMTHAVMDSPLGELTLVGNDGALAGLYFAGQRNRPRPLRLGRPDPAGLAEPVRQLGEYFAGTRKVFSLPLDFAGTEFQRSVWAALLTIPYGETRSYGEIARQIGKPAAVTLPSNCT